LFSYIHAIKLKVMWLLRGIALLFLLDFFNAPTYLWVITGICVFVYYVYYAMDMYPIDEYTHGEDKTDTPT